MGHGEAVQEIYKMRDALDQTWDVVVAMRQDDQHTRLRQELEFAIRTLETVAERISSIAEHGTSDD